YAPSIAPPVIYVGGDGGVFRAFSSGSQTNWIRFTGAGNGASSDGGGLPVVKVTDLDLALGNIDKNTGRTTSIASPDQLVATTLGRGTWSIGIETPAGVSGPRVIDFSPKNPQFSPIDQVMIKFDSLVSDVKPSSFTIADVTVTGPGGQPVTVDQV